MSATVRNIAVYALRVIAGAVFVVSGYVKAVDLWGGMYKMHEYMAAFGLHLPYEAELVMAALLASCEFALGICLIFGIMRRLTPWCMAAFMAVMTPLTLWIWLTDPVADCGCFGDAIVISNGATFAKNIVLCVLCVLLLLYNRSVPPVITPRRQWLAVIASFVYAGMIGAIGYNDQPLDDFRPYAIGARLLADDADTQGFVYERDGEHRVFTADSLPDDDSWTFVEREQATAAQSLAVFDAEGDDVTDDVLDVDNAYILVINDVPRHGISRSRMQNAIKAYADSTGYDMFALLAVQPAALDNWARRLHADYPVYAADDTDLKALVRGDAALVVVRNGRIAYKSNLYHFSPDSFESGHHPVLTYAAARNRKRWLNSAYVLILILLSMHIDVKVTKGKHNDNNTQTT